jgi:hypothetical protein
LGRVLAALAGKDMVNATHLKSAYCEHARELARRYTSVVSKRPVPQSDFIHHSVPSSPEQSQNRTAATTTWAATGEFDIYC